MGTKKQPTAVTKYDGAIEELKKNMRAYINTPDRFAEVLAAVKKLKDFTKEMEESVKKRGGEIMFDQDLKEIEFGDYVVRSIDPSETNEYSPASVVKTFIDEYGDEGISMVSQFLSVSAPKIEKWAIKAKVPITVIEKFRAGMRTKIKKGFVALYPKRAKKEGDGPVYIR